MAALLKNPATPPSLHGIADWKAQPSIGVAKDSATPLAGWYCFGDTGHGCCQKRCYIACTPPATSPMSLWPASLGRWCGRLAVPDLHHLDPVASKAVRRAVSLIRPFLPSPAAAEPYRASSRFLSLRCRLPTEPHQLKTDVSACVFA